MVENDFLIRGYNVVILTFGIKFRLMFIMYYNAGWFKILAL